MRALGDEYIKAGLFKAYAIYEIFSLLARIIEFRRHRDITNPIHIIGFLSEWKKYLDTLPKGTEDGMEWRGRKLNSGIIEKVCNFCLRKLLPGWSEPYQSCDLFSRVDVRGAVRSIVRADARHQGCLEESN